ncbi:MAG: hypothetical protein DRN17_04830 [Thermoplasmata archaeon]|nr:MAG: hypothetical protein DRN17_04830 [Thermoplasmata archaeon]
MIQLRQVFYHKIGTHKDTDKTIYKYFFASIDPHFYFAAYVIPYEDSFKITFDPFIGNIANDGVIEFSDEMSEYAYGEEVRTLVSNQYLAGYSDIATLIFAIEERPVIVNSSSINFPDIEESRTYSRDLVKPLDDIGLHTLANTLKIEVEAKLSAVMSSALGVDQNNAVDAIVKSVLVSKNIFIQSLPEDMNVNQKEYTFDMFSRIYNTSPVTSNIVDIFADGILFGIMTNNENILLETIPYEIRFRLSTNWMKTKSDDAVDQFKVAAAGVIKTETLELNMSTMEDLNKLYEVIQKTQSFVYLTEMSITRDSDNETIIFPIENEYHRNYAKTSERCEETKGIPSTNGQILIQYGYGQNCDSFVAIKTLDNTGWVRGFSRDDRIIEDDYITARTWKWEAEEIVKYGAEIDNTESVTIIFKGV